MSSNDAKHLYQNASQTAQHIRDLLPETLSHPKIAIVCGSGLGGLADTIHPEPKFELPYAQVPGFPVSTVPGHAGKLIFGLIGPSKTPIMLLVGRAHFYEGYSMQQVTYATRTCKALAIPTVILTNAAGGLNPAYKVGDIVIVNDHINLPGLTGSNPLLGPNDDALGPRFPPLSDAYSLSLRRLAHAAWSRVSTSTRSTTTTTSSSSNNNNTLGEGVYAFVTGPSYETRAECRLLAALGADLVGMSTVPEVLVARHSGLEVLVLSLVTNACRTEAPVRGDAREVAGMSEASVMEFMSRGAANHQEVVHAGKEAAEVMQVFVREIVEGVVQRNQSPS